jgi:hypothetical protein
MTPIPRDCHPSWMPHAQHYNGVHSSHIIRLKCRGDPRVIKCTTCNMYYVTYHVSRTYRVNYTLMMNGLHYVPPKHNVHLDHIGHRGGSISEVALYYNILRLSSATLTSQYNMLTKRLVSRVCHLQRPYGPTCGIYKKPHL